LTDDDREAYEFYADPANRELRGTPRKRKAPRLTNMASVRFDPAVIETATAIAREEGITVSSWIRRLVQRETEPPRMVEVACDGLDEPLRVPQDALERILWAAMPAIIKHGSVNLQIGTPRQRGEWIQARRHELEVVPGSGRQCEPRSIPSSLELKRGYGVTTETASTLAGRTFACPHLTVGNAMSVSCGICGPLREAC